ncbi:MFS transporter [Amnibacterium setariae]|uniref:MFS transporter n=1 Tax=Amnibacterium setariae TaxID=2306585 RepID=A0A3A1U0K6_9MICO|nr:MFS transporter [Amnibacterium setariae]RIX27986.1 MFS transporter [Amnibacterium setariae]
MPGFVASLGALHEPDFRRLVTGTAISRFGSGLAGVALAFAVLDLTGSAAALGLVVGVRSIANVALLLLGGVLADRLPRGLLLTGSSVLSGVAQLGAAGIVAARLDLVWVLAALAAVNGAASAVSQPLATALVPQTLPADRLQEGNALARMSGNTTSLIGTAVAGLVVAVAGSAVAVAVDGVSFLLAAAIWAGLRAPAPARAERTTLLQDLAAGWHGFRTRRWLWTVVGAFTLSNLCYAGAVLVLGPVHADATIGRPAWGLVQAALPAGLVLGGLVALRLRPRRPLVVAMLATVPFPLTGLAIGLVPVPAVLVLLVLLAGVGAEVFEVLWETTMQRRVPADLLARVSSYDLLGSYIAIPVGQLAAAPVAAVLGVRTTMVAAGALGAAALLACLLVRDVRAEEPAA